MQGSSPATSTSSTMALKSFEMHSPVSNQGFSSRIRTALRSGKRVLLKRSSPVSLGNTTRHRQYGTSRYHMVYRRDIRSWVRCIEKYWEEDIRHIVANIFLFYERLGRLDLYDPYRLIIDTTAGLDGLFHARVLEMPLGLTVCGEPGALCMDCAGLALRDELDRLLAGLPIPELAGSSTPVSFTSVEACAGGSIRQDSEIEGNE